MGVCYDSGTPSMSTNPLKPTMKPVHREAHPYTPPENLFSKLSCYKELREKLASNVPVPEIMRWLRTDKKLFTDKADETLQRALYRLKSRIPVEERSAVSTAGAAAVIAQEREKLAKETERRIGKLNELDELEKLYWLQRERIGIDVDNEKSIKKLFGSTSNDIRLAMDLLTKRAQLKMDLGEDTRHIGTVGVDVTKTLAVVGSHYVGNAGVQKALANPESRRKVLHGATQLLRLVGERGEAEALLNELEAVNFGDDPADESAPSATTKRIIDVAPEPAHEPSLQEQVDSISEEDFPEEGSYREEDDQDGGVL